MLKERRKRAQIDREIRRMEYEAHPDYDPTWGFIWQCATDDIDRKVVAFFNPELHTVELLEYYAGADLRDPIHIRLFRSDIRGIGRVMEQYD